MLEQFIEHQNHTENNQNNYDANDYDAYCAICAGRSFVIVIVCFYIGATAVMVKIHAM